MNKFLWDGKPWQAFKTFAIIFSFVMNFVLLLVLLIAAPLLLPVINQVVNPLVGGLNQSFEDMSTATISRTIEVNDTIPINFNLPLNTQTSVTLTDDVRLDGVPTTFILPGGGGVINGAVSLTLPRGVALPVQLDLNVPVDQEIDVSLAVAVQIPMQETELGAPFNQLKALFGPLDALVRGLPGSSAEFFDRMAQTEGTGPTLADSPVPR